MTNPDEHEKECMTWLNMFNLAANFRKCVTFPRKAKRVQHAVLPLESG